MKDDSDSSVDIHKDQIIILKKQVQIQKMKLRGIRDRKDGIDPLDFE